MKSKHFILEMAMPVVFIVIAVAAIINSRSMGSEGVFPAMVAAVMIISAVYLAVELILKREKTVELEGLNLKKVAVTFLALVLYVALLKKIGYIIGTFLLCVFIIRSLGYKNIPKTLICTVLTVAAAFIIFKVLLAVPLPMILLNF